MTKFRSYYMTWALFTILRVINTFFLIQAKVCLSCGRSRFEVRDRGCVCVREGDKENEHSMP